MALKVRPTNTTELLVPKPQKEHPPPKKKEKEEEKREAILRLPHPDTLHFDYFALRDHTTS